LFLAESHGHNLAPAGHAAGEVVNGLPRLGHPIQGGARSGDA
jgi:hypothetical protein